MIPEKLKDLWPLIYTWLNGGRVQIKIISDWRDVQSISDFKNFNNEFREYSEPKLVPFTFEDAEFLIGKPIRSKQKNVVLLIQVVYQKSIMMHGFDTISYYSLLQNWEFLDGSPCGKYME